MDRKIVSAAVAGALLLAFSGCAGKTGNEKLAELPKEQIGQQIVNGKTTKDEVKSFLGDRSNG